MDHTIDPQVNVLRVDKVVRGRRVPIGGWSTFADHGTVTKSSFQYYNQDHHASAIQVFEQRVRRAGRVPRAAARAERLRQLERGRPVGRPRARRPRRVRLRGARRGRRDGARLAAARSGAHAGARSSTCAGRAPASAARPPRAATWRTTPMIGFPFLTGSEEERGPAVRRDAACRSRARATRCRCPGQGHKTGIPLERRRPCRRRCRSPRCAWATA